MKHVFLLNPTAGKGDCGDWVQTQIREACTAAGEEYEIYITRCQDDARTATIRFCEKYRELRLYACGGDGTLSEVINGAVGFAGAAVSVVPIGTGNDFVKNFENPTGFLDIPLLIRSADRPVDLIKINDKSYAVNLCNAGFDAEVAKNMGVFKTLPFIKRGMAAYNISVAYSLLKPIGKQMRVVLDGQQVLEESFLLLAVGNGAFYGGGYKAAPTARIDDGILNFCGVRKLSRFKIARLIGLYKEGMHPESEEIKDYIEYRECRKVEIRSLQPFSFSVDGECSLRMAVTLELIPGAIRFIAP